MNFVDCAAPQIAAGIAVGIIDQSRLTRDAMGALLIANGFTIAFSVGSLAEARKHVETEPCPVVILTPARQKGQAVGDEPDLSGREVDVLSCLVDGLSNKQIARTLEIAEATVKVHVKSVLRKVKADNRTQAAIWGLSNGSALRRHAVALTGE